MSIKYSTVVHQGKMIRCINAARGTTQYKVIIE